jgi:molybdate/tungstate transport system substrate-binding protein
MKTNFFFLMLLGTVILLGCNQEKAPQYNDGLSGELTIFHAGSLSVPFKVLADSFQKIHPEVKILTESAGSLASIRKITDLGRNCDILASADYILIDKLMIPEFATWNLLFAGNEMSIVYTEHSKYAKEIDQNNWPEILQRTDVIFGRSDPNSDPCGYRTILTWKLLEEAANQKGLAEKLLKKDNRYIRPKEVDLLALLESGAIDYIFLYKSVAIQHKLPYLKLPDSINLASPFLNEFYSKVSVDVTGNKPGETISQTGEPMIYGLTIPGNSLRPDLAEEFVKFILEKGLPIIEKLGQSYVKPSYSEKSTAPEFINPLISE